MSKKMNKEIQELAEQLPISAEVRKSIVNRLESALTKTGSASSRLKMASASMNALAEKYTDDEAGYADLIARVFSIGAQIGVDNKKEATPKTKREQWHDADSAEAKAILASKSPSKPRKTKSVNTDAFANLIESIPLEALLEAMAKARR
ncbi:hypothetical protein EBR66_08220 [bacterium]|nr:hypothetical protein [bacterium]